MLTPSKIDSVLKGGEIKCYYFHMQINHYDNLIKMPEVYLNKMKILSAFSITCDWLLETPLIGYINECEKITNVLNSSQNNILVIHGRSGVGKSRLLKEYYHKMKSMYPHTFLITPDLDASLCNCIKYITQNFNLQCIKMRLYAYCYQKLLHYHADLHPHQLQQAKGNPVP